MCIRDRAVFRVRSLAAYAIHKFFQERGFVYVHTPLITGSDCEGAGEMFRVTTLDMDQIPKNEDCLLYTSRGIRNPIERFGQSDQTEIRGF